MNTPHIATRWPAVATATIAVLGLAVAMPAGASALGPPGRAQTATASAKVVTNTNDKGTGSLRAAIFAVNNNPELWDAINFDIPGPRPHVIAPLTLLPSLTSPVTIDGYTEHGAKAADETHSATLAIVIDAAGLPGGLELDTDDSTVRGLVVRGANGDGIQVNGDWNTIAGNYVGVTPNGEAAAGNGGDGIFVIGHRNAIGGYEPADRNVVSANGGSGVVLIGTDNRVQGNLVGTDDDGETALGNGDYGIEADGDGDGIGGNGIGGSDPPLMNLVSANASGGIHVGSGPGTDVSGNLVGTDITGLQNLGNGGAGVYVAANASSVAENIVGWSAGPGIVLQADRSGVFLNQVGGNVSGSKPAALPNQGDGLVVAGSENAIGGPAEGNTVSGNAGNGIRIASGTGNDVQSNYVGTDSVGTALFGNVLDGIVLQDTQNLVGGSTPDLANVVSGNGLAGVDIQASDNRVVGNLVGTDPNGTRGLPNVEDGIEITADRTLVFGNTAAFNLADGIGIDADGTRVGSNTVRSNLGAGVAVTGGTGNPLVGNLISGNTGLGIDLGPVGPTRNDRRDGDAGANDLLNFPVVNAAGSVVNGTRVDWSVRRGLPNTAMQLEFFLSDTCNGSGFGEGATLLGTVATTTSDRGNATSGRTFAVPSVPGQVVTATATLLPVALGSTSEFSECTTVG